jgi:MFS family permease
MTSDPNQRPFTTSYKQIWAGIIGNALEHYDTALFGLLAPFLSQIFFPTLHPINALILTYAILPLDLLAKPIGALLFGRIGDKFGRHYALSISIGGTSIMTGMIGFVPTWESAGMAAPLILTGMRLFQKLCAAGETIGGAIYILEHQGKRNRNLLSSIYDCSSILGILLASALITVATWFQLVESFWRGFFFLGFATGSISLYIRVCGIENFEFKSRLTSAKTSLWAALKLYRKEFFAIIAVSGLTYSTYQFSLVFLNGFLPLVSNVTAAEVYSANTQVLVLDLLFLPLFGMLADRYGATRQMLFSCFALFCTAIPLLMMCDQASLPLILLIRCIWVWLAIWFSAPFHAWIQQLVPPEHRYTLLSFGYAIGTQVIGAPLPSVALWLYKSSGLIYAPAFYLMGIVLLAIVGIVVVKKPSVSPVSVPVSLK